jgi:hypothetical protein
MSAQAVAQTQAVAKPTITPVARGLLQRACACGQHTGSGGECEECKKKHQGMLRRTAVNNSSAISPARKIQTKLAINKPGDAHEQEADRIADQVMSAPAHGLNHHILPRIQRLVGQSNAQIDTAPTSVDQALASPGQQMEPTLQQDMERRFGYDFSQVRVHCGTLAEQSARDINAHAYTVGNNIVFGAGRYTPNNAKGKQLIAHELTHVVQQASGICHNFIQRRSGCSDPQDNIIDADHARARSMLSIAIDTVKKYNGTTPTKVFNALSKHFGGATSNGFSIWLNTKLRVLWSLSWMAGYECYEGGIFERTWACGPQDLATTFWCVPGVDIRLCPLYFAEKRPIERSTTLIHEWFHKYGCNLDLGYESESEYSKSGTLRQSLNADSFANFVRDVQ